MVYEVSGAKALLGTVFIEYMIYAFVYIIEGIRLRDFDQIKAEQTGAQPKN